MAKGSGEHQSVETTTALLSQALEALTNTVNSTNAKVDDVLEQLAEGNGKFKDIEHNCTLIDLRIKAIEASHAQSANTKQSVMMMLIDKGVGVLLPWSAIAYMVWGKSS